MPGVVGVVDLVVGGTRFGRGRGLARGPDTNVVGRCGLGVLVELPRRIVVESSTWVTTPGLSNKERRLNSSKSVVTSRSGRTFVDMSACGIR